MEKIFIYESGKLVYQGKNYEVLNQEYIEKYTELINGIDVCPMTGFIRSDLIEYYLSKDLPSTDFFYVLANKIKHANPEIVFDWRYYLLDIEISFLIKKDAEQIKKMGYTELYDMDLGPKMWEDLPIFDQIYLSGDGYEILTTVQQFQIICLRQIVQAKLDFFRNLAKSNRSKK